MQNSVNEVEGVEISAAATLCHVSLSQFCKVRFVKSDDSTGSFWGTLGKASLKLNAH